MSVLLTGGAGYIGSHTCIELLQAGEKIVVADNFSNSSPEAMQRVMQHTAKKFPVYPIDVGDAEAMSRLFEQEKIDSVIHFAGFKAVGESAQKPLTYYRNNLGCLMTLLETMQKYGTKNLVFSSSATVYGMTETPRLTEEMPYRCVNPYGRTKQMAEEIIKDLCAADAGFSAMLLRYFNPVGAHPSGCIGEEPRGVPNNLMPYIVQAAAGELPYLKIFGKDYPTPDGTGRRDYIHVTELASGHVAALQYARCHSGVQAFNFGTGRPYSVLEVVKTFERVNGVTVPYRFVPRREGDLAEYFADPSRANKILHWQAKKTLEDMCKDAWNWKTKNANG